LKTLDLFGCVIMLVLPCFVGWKGELL
jgi:hypothetical protein